MIKLRQNFRSISYALILGLVFFLNRNINAQHSKIGFAIGISIGLLILWIQLYTIRKTSQNKLIQVGLPSVTRYSDYKSTVLHYVIPNLFYLSFCAITYINPYEVLTLVFIPFVIAAFFFVFLNIRAYYEDKFKIEITTHTIYVLITVAIVFMLTNVLLNVTSILDMHYFFLFPMLFGLSAIGFYLLFFENIHLNMQLILILLIASIIIGITAMVIYSNFGSVLRNSFITVSCFYFVAASVHHKIDGSLNLGILTEYLSIFALSFVLLYGIN